MLAALAPLALAVALPQASERLFGVRARPVDPRFADELKCIDPAVDRWPTEVAHDAAKPVLSALVAALYEGAEPEKLRAMLASTFDGATELRPAALEVVHDASGVRVKRAKAISAERHDAGSLATLATALREPFGGARVRTEALVTGIELEQDARTFTTVVRVQASARPAGGPVQQTAQWRVEWIRSDEPPGAPLVHGITLERFEEASAARELFADATARVLGDLPFFADEFGVGQGALRYHSDQIAGDGFLGGHGLAVGDVDGDGLDDVYVCMQGGSPNRLLMHQPHGTVVDRAPSARVNFLDLSRSALIADFDGDGAQDLAVALGPNIVVAYNDGRATFGDQILLPGPSVEEIFSLAAADPDRDGDLDLYACRYVVGGMIGGVPLPYHDAQNGAPNIYWRNERRGKFTNATAEAGFGAANRSYSLAALWEDFDEDGDLDLYVANDFGRNNLFRNEGGRFRDVATELGADDMAAGMGASMADFDLDGDLDLYVSNMFSAAGLRIAGLSERFMNGAHPELTARYLHHARGNTLLSSKGDGTFEDVTDRLGVAFGRWAWGAKFADFDGDGYEDLYVPNGFITNTGSTDVESFFWRRVISQSPPDTKLVEGYRRAWASLQQVVLHGAASFNGHERNCAYLNLRGGAFADVAALSGADFEDDCRAAATTDWDDDGRLDLVLANRSAPRVRVLCNQSVARNHFLALDLAGAAGNRDAIGARVTVELEGRTLRKSLYAGEGYLAQSSKRLHFGLGDAERAKRVEVRWPDGSKSTVEDLAADARYRIVQGEAGAKVVAPRTLDGFAPASAEAAPTGSGRVDRIVLAERLPISPLPLPRLDGTPRKVSDLAGRAALIVLCRTGAPGCAELLGELSRRAQTLEAAGLQVVAVSADHGPKLYEAKRNLEKLGLASTGGYADGQTLTLLEVLLITVLQNADEILLPASLLVDANGHWTALYEGALDFERLRADVDALAAESGKGRSTAKLTRGIWIVRPQRDLTPVANVFANLGASELATFYRGLAARDAAKGK